MGASGYENAMNSDSLVTARLAALGIFGVSAGALGAAYIAQYGFGLEPCILCLYQRVPYLLTGLIALLSLFLRPDPRVQRRLVLACAVLFAIGGTIAFYHVGVERHWWVSLTACGGTAPTGIGIEQLQADLLAKPARRCDQPEWSLFGITMAGYNVIFSLLLAVGTWYAAGFLKEGRR